MLRKFFGYFGGMIVHPGATLDELARESSIRFAVLLVIMELSMPSILISSVFNDLLLGGVIPNLLTGHPFAFTAAQTGEFGSFIQIAWWIYMMGIYILVKDAWTIVLGTLANRQVQKIPTWAAAIIMMFGYFL